MDWKTRLVSRNCSSGTTMSAMPEKDCRISVQGPSARIVPVCWSQCPQAMTAGWSTGSREATKARSRVLLPDPALPVTWHSAAWPLIARSSCALIELISSARSTQSVCWSLSRMGVAMVEKYS